jgi:putative transposase
LTVRIERHFIRKNHPLFAKADALCFQSKNLYNVAMYLMRQTFILAQKKKLSSVEEAFIAEINNSIEAYNHMRKSKGKKTIATVREKSNILPYGFLAWYLKSHADYKALPSQTAQWVLRQVTATWKSFLKAISVYAKDPSRFTGKPKIPGYKKKHGRNLVVFTNQQCYIQDGFVCFFRNRIPTKVNASALREVRLVPVGSGYSLEVVYQCEPAPLKREKPTRIASMDLGLHNFVTIVTSMGTTPVAVKGETIKACNQFYNKEMAKLQRIAKRDNGVYRTKRMIWLTEKRNRRMNDFMHKASRFVIQYCQENDIDTLVVGINKGWKQHIELGKVNNQRYVQIPYDMFIQKLRYKCVDAGIRFIEQEESYTSMASFLDDDPLEKMPYYSGKRIARGLYRTIKGICVNADVNGAYNILRKVFPNAISKRDSGCLGLHPVRVGIA